MGSAFLHCQCSEEGRGYPPPAQQAGGCQGRAGWCECALPGLGKSEGQAFLLLPPLGPRQAKRAVITGEIEISCI